MQGQVLDYSIQTNEGIISGVDGSRYTFSGSEWREAVTPSRGMTVDFETEGARAVGVYRALGRGAANATPTDAEPGGTAAMQGQVLDYSVQANEGVISGDDGIRYTFAGSEWREDVIPARGMRVDFAVDGSNAAGVYRVLGRGQFAANIQDSVSSAFSRSGATGSEITPGNRFVGYLVEVGIRIGLSIVTWLVIGLPLGIVTLGSGLFLMPIIASAMLFGYYWLMYATQSEGLGHKAIGATLINYATGEPLSMGRAAARRGGHCRLVAFPHSNPD